MTKKSMITALTMFLATCIFSQVVFAEVPMAYDENGKVQISYEFTGTGSFWGQSFLKEYFEQCICATLEEVPMTKEAYLIAETQGLTVKKFNKKGTPYYAYGTPDYMMISSFTYYGTLENKGWNEIHLYKIVKNEVENGTSD